MDFFQAMLLGVVQGITEFLPVSSSGHLILTEHFLNLHVSDLLMFDVVLHAGTLVALVYLFWDKLVGILKGNWKLFWMLVIATIPAAIVGVMFDDYLETVFRSVTSVAIAFICVGVFFLGTRFMKNKRKTVGWRDVILMSLAQAAALIPGVSRSGSTTATGEYSGLKREHAAEFSFLMLLPVVCGALALMGVKFAKGEVVMLPTEILLVGFITSAVVSFFSAKFMLKFFKSFGLTIFAVYLLLLGFSVLLFV